MKEVIVEKFDGAVLSVIVGDRVTLDESAALQLVEILAARTTERNTLDMRRESLQTEANKIAEQLSEIVPELEADTARAKAIIALYVTECQKNSLTVPAALADFVGVIDTPDEPAAPESDIAPEPALPPPTTNAAASATEPASNAPPQMV